MIELGFLIPGVVFLVVLVVTRFLWSSDGAGPRRRQWARELVPAAVAGILAWAVLWFIEHVLAVRFLSGGTTENSIAEASRWTALVYFVTMVLGMVAQTLWHALEQRRGRQPVAFDKWEFVKPGLVAPIVFLAVYQHISHAEITMIMLIFSFQNGFFWQTILRRSRT